MHRYMTIGSYWLGCILLGKRRSRDAYIFSRIVKKHYKMTTVRHENVFVVDRNAATGTFFFFLLAGVVHLPTIFSP